MYYNRSGSSVRGQSHSVKTSDRKIIALFQKIAESNGDVRIFDRKQGNISLCACTVHNWPKTAHNDWRDVVRPSSCNAFVLLPLLVSYNATHSTAMKILSLRPSVCQTRGLWQNKESSGQSFYTIWKNVYPSFPTRRLVGNFGPNWPLEQIRQFSIDIRS